MFTIEKAAVRSITDADFDVVAAIFGHYVEHTTATFETVPPSTAHWREKAGELAGRGLPFLVVEVDGAVAGFAYAAPWRTKPAYRHTVENTVYLAPEWTGKGLGRLLLDSLIERCREAGMRQVIAVIAGDGASVALHRKCGFTEAGVLRNVGFKFGRWLDTRLFQREL
ncbi:GNAT family N-acetyltransferase [Amycolatopsis magusensis]|uniref:GNAT family N-acetyltransferase n=1 Tax=Amycolatopsis magusensis TaxID=882444 RepID=UPI00379502A3